MSWLALPRLCRQKLGAGGREPRGRSMRLTLQIKQPVRLFYCFDVVWYHVYNLSTKLHWVINHVAVLSESALQAIDFYLHEF